MKILYTLSIKSWAIIIGVFTLFVGGVFYGGMQYGEHRLSTATSNQTKRPTPVLKEGARSVVTGSVISVEDKKVSVKTREGNTRLVILSETTEFRSTAPNGAADVKAGVEVVINGKNNADGSLAAELVQIRPARK